MNPTIKKCVSLLRANEINYFILLYCNKLIEFLQFMSKQYLKKKIIYFEIQEINLQIKNNSY